MNDMHVIKTRETAIQKELDRIESEEEVKILYACESGSRAWGFESQDSDYDVRFFYIRPPAWYLSIQKRRDVIERMLDDGLLDLVGWDLPKTLELFRKSNPPLYEKLRSPIVYRESGSFLSRIRDLIPEYFSPKACLHHYHHMAQGNFQKYIQGRDIIGKRYFYILRPVLACLWIEQDIGPVPMEFEILVRNLITDHSFLEAIDELLNMKRAGMEMDNVPQIPVITEFLKSHLERLGEVYAPLTGTSDPERLDMFFHELLAETWGVDVSSIQSQT